jgi:uncharacterized membrane protein
MENLFLPPKQRIRVPFDLNDKISEVISLIVLITTISIVAITVPGLPDTIPSHYSMRGEIDAYESKHMLWVIIALSVIIYIGLTILAMFPGLYKKKLTGENIEEQYRLTSKTTRTMKAVIVLSFLVVSYFITHAAQIKNTESILYLAPFFLLFVLVVRLGKA